MLRDAELATRDYVALVCSGLPAERDINLTTATLRQAQTALTMYADPAWAPTGWALLAATARTALDAAEPGSGFQLAWARGYLASARSTEDLAVLRGWLTGEGVPPGLTVDTELRWSLLQSLAKLGGATDAEIGRELDGDRTASGEREAALARALLPTAENKARVWAQLTGTEELPNWLHRSLLQGFQTSTQVELTAPYAARFFGVVDEVWKRSDSEPAQEFVMMAYPAYQVSEETVTATDAWLAADGHNPSLRRLVAEGRDGVVRALKARRRDMAEAAGR
jgi:aminopeptidase N